MFTEFTILVAVVLGAIALGSAWLTRLPKPKNGAALAVAMCGNVGLLGLALVGPDDQRTVRLVMAAAAFAVGSLLLMDIDWAHELLAAGAGIVVVDRARTELEPVFTPDGWAGPDEHAILWAWAAALVAGTLLVVALRSSNPGKRFAVAGIWGAVGLALALASALDLFPSLIVVVVLTLLPLGVALPQGRPQAWPV